MLTMIIFVPSNGMNPLCRRRRRRQRLSFVTGLYADDENIAWIYNFFL